MTEKDFIRSRKTHLEDLRALANKYLSENKTIKDSHEHKWESEVVENNIKQLKRIISEANKGLDQKELTRYGANQVSSFAKFKNTIKVEFENGETVENYMTKMLDGFETFEVVTYSPGFSIVYDLYWIPDGTLGEQRNVAVGSQSPDIYGKYCTERLTVIKNEVIPYLQAKASYHNHVKLLNDIVDAFGKSSFLFLNIVLITAAESLVRELCSFVYSKQNTSKQTEEVQEYIYKTFNSLETLVMKTDWKEDFPVTVNEARYQSKFINEPSLNKSVTLIERHNEAQKQVVAEMSKITELIEKANSGKIPNDDSLKRTILDHVSKVQLHRQGLLADGAKIFVTIRSRLQFLMRRYKEDRNSTIHGNYAEFDKGWKTYVYLSAITKIFDLIKEYDQVYPQSKITPRHPI